MVELGRQVNRRLVPLAKAFSSGNEDSSSLRTRKLILQEKPLKANSKMKTLTLPQINRWLRKQYHQMKTLQTNSKMQTLTWAKNSMTACQKKFHTTYVENLNLQTNSKMKALVWAKNKVTAHQQKCQEKDSVTAHQNHKRSRDPPHQLEGKHNQKRRPNAVTTSHWSGLYAVALRCTWEGIW